MTSSPTLLLMHFDGANNSTSFVDSSAYATPFTIDQGSPVLSTTQAKFGPSSYRGNIISGFPGGAIGVIGSNAAFDIWQSDWTFELQAYWTHNFSSSTWASFGKILPAAGAQFNSVANNPYIDFVSDGSGNLIAYITDSSGTSWGGSFPTGPALPANAWTHIAFVRHSNVLKLYVNGIVSNTTYAQPTTNLSGLIYAAIGGSRSSSAESFVQGYMDEVRLSNYAVYTANFAPPTAPFIAYTTAFSMSPIPARLNSPVSFTDTSTGPGDTEVSWSWNFGDGATSVLQDPTHTYTTAGTYSVSLTPTWALGGSQTAAGQSILAINVPNVASLAAPPAPTPVTVQSYLSLIIPEHNNSLSAPVVVPPVARSRACEGHDSVVAVAGVTVAMSGAMRESRDTVTTSLRALSKIFETTVTTPPFATSGYTTATSLWPVITGMSLSGGINIVDRSNYGTTFAQLAGDGNIYNYSATTGAYVSTTVEGAVEKAWGARSQNGHAPSCSGFTLSSSGYGAMGTTEGNSVCLRFLAAATGYASNSSAYAVVVSGYSTGAATYLFDCFPALSGAPNVPSGFFIKAVYPCSDGAHILMITANASNTAPYVWSVVKVTGGAATLVSTGAFPTLYVPTVGALSGDFADSDPSDPNEPKGCLDVDLQTLWLQSGSNNNGVTILKLTNGNTATVLDTLASVYSGSPIAVPGAMWVSNGYGTFIRNNQLALWSF
jgi:PKD repeat protein